MATTLKMIQWDQGIILSRPITGEYAGILTPLTADGKPAGAWQFLAPDGSSGPRRNTREAAQFDALAYAAEQTGD